MTPLLCLNCGKVRSEHTGVAYGFCYPWPELTEWREPTEIEQRVIEQRTVEQIATWLESNSNHRYQAIGADIRSGVWKVKLSKKRKPKR